MKFTFSENNSGGYWWLDEKQYKSLFDAGWQYEPSEYDVKNNHHIHPFLGSKGDKVPYGWRHNLTFEADSIEDAVRSWEEATGVNFFEGGCPCCGPPFNMDGGGEYLSGGYEQMKRPF